MTKQVIREREKQKTDQQQRKWSRREEQNFLRTILAYGVEYSSKEARFVWDRFEHIFHSFVTKTVDSFSTCLDSEPLVGWRASSTRRWWSTTSPSWPCASALPTSRSPRRKVRLTSVGFKRVSFNVFLGKHLSLSSLATTQ